jgi:hypothetical protein
VNEAVCGIQQRSNELNIPFYPVLGNHDYGNGDPYIWSVAGLQYQYSNPAYPDCRLPGGLSSGKWHLDYRYYEFKKENVQFLALDTTPMVAESWQDDPRKGNGMGRQENYVQKQSDDVIGVMKSTNALWKIGSGHHTYISNGPHGNAGSYDNLQCPTTEAGTNGWACGTKLQKFVKLMCENGLDLYLSGHDHSLQWLYATTGTCDSNNPSRQVEFIIAGAGASTTACGSDFCERGNHARFQRLTLGFVYIVVNGNRMDVNIVDASDPEVPQVRFSRPIQK